MTSQDAPADPFGTIYPDQEHARRLGNYVLQQRIGSGGMGDVFLATHQRFQSRRYAVKLLRPGLTSPDALDRFEREIEAMAHLEHPNLVYALDAGRQDQQLYLVMEYVEGLDAQQLVDQMGPLDIGQACHLVQQAAMGVAHAHRLNIVHRDLKPSNLMVSRQGEVKVLDMGLASLGCQQSNELTAAGSYLGTPAYMSPEQWRDSRTATPASDVYSLACALYSLLAGRPPFSFQAGNVTDLMQRHLLHDPPLLESHREGVPKPLSTLIDQALHKDPGQRPPTAESFAVALREYADDTLAPVVGFVEGRLDAEIDTARPSVQTHLSPALPFSSAGDAGDPEIEDLRWSRNVQRPEASMKRISLITGVLIAIAGVALVMAYFGPGTTEAWTERFDRLQARKVPPGTGFFIELVRVVYFIGATVYLVGTRFTASIRKVFDVRQWNRQLLTTRLITLVLIGFFVNAETQRHLSLDRAPSDMVQWAADHEIETTAAAEAVPYAWYLPYSLVNYIVVLGALFAFPFFRFWLSDYRYMLKQLQHFAKVQQTMPSAEAAVRNLHRFGVECRSLTMRYLDVLGVLCTGIHFEYWIGRLTLTEAGVMTVVMGWAVAAFAAAFVLAISGVYAQGYSTTARQLTSDESLQQEAAMTQLNLAWFLKTTVLSQLGGVLLLSLVVVGLHAAMQ